MSTLINTIKAGDELELTIERMAYGPTAVGRLPQGIVVFVQYGAPGDHALVKVHRVKKNYAEASIIKILNPGASRVDAPCPYFYKCGGCQWQHLDYATQVQSKKEILAHQISRALGQPLTLTIVAHPAPHPFHYRTRLQVRGDENGIGFFQANSRTITHIDRCLVASEKIQNRWHEFLKNGEHLTLSQNSKNGAFKIEWTLKDKVLESVNQHHAADGFTQVNDEQNAVMQSVVKTLALQEHNQSQDTLLDLYAGDGNLSHSLEPFFSKIVRVEASPGKDRSNEQHQSGKILRHNESVADFFAKKHHLPHSVAVVIADPPREGIGQDICQELIALKTKRLILVSCDPSTLGRDLGTLSRAYQIESVHMIDMFPQTYHIESVVSLTLRSEY